VAKESGVNLEIRKTMQVKISDEGAFVDALKLSAKFVVPQQCRLYLCFDASYNVSGLIAFLQSASEIRSSIDIDEAAMQFLIKDWGRRWGTTNLTYDEWTRFPRDCPKDGWTWGWAEFDDEQNGTLHMFNDPLTDAELVDPTRLDRWLKERFGDAKITHPPPPEW
jgi:hypothetical protein